jgi:hypothetical protein
MLYDLCFMHTDSYLLIEIVKTHFVLKKSTERKRLTKFRVKSRSLYEHDSISRCIVIIILKVKSFELM